MSEEKLNPRGVEIEIGIRTPRKITIYPLSVRDQMKLSDLITEALRIFFASTNKEDIEFVSTIINIISKNLNKIMLMIVPDERNQLQKMWASFTKKEVDMLIDISNNQMLEIVQHVFDMNYGDPLKNAKSLFEKAKELFLSERLLQPSAKDTGTS
jgi:Golgi nucleoside diphosphatase